MATPEIKIVQDALAGMAAGKPEAYMSVVDDNIEFDCLSGLLPDAVAQGTGKDAFMKMAGAQGDCFQQVSFTPHSWTGFGPHVGFIVDWELKLKQADGSFGPTCPLRACVLKTVRDGKICQKFHMLNQDQVALMTGRPAKEVKSVSAIRGALNDMAAGNFETYKALVHPTDFEFSVLAGLHPPGIAVGKGADAFWSFGAKGAETVEQLRFVQHSWCGYGDHVTFAVEWECRIKATGKTHQFHAIVYKKLVDGKLCQKTHLLDQAQCEAMLPRN